MAWNRCVRERRSWLSCLGMVALLLSLGSAGLARAAEPPRDPKQEAKARFVSGQSHYNLNEFPQALLDFKEAYRIYPDPVFLFNLGQCERQLGHLDEAMRFYRSFLREQPKAPNRQDVLHKIEEMEAAQKAKPTEGDKGATPLPPVEPPEAARPAPAPAVQAEKMAPGPSTPMEQAAAAAPPTSPAPTPLPTTPPVNPDIAGATPDRVDLSATPTPQPEAEAPPFYKRWWFWTAAAAAVAVGAGVGIYAATSNNGPAVPASVLGSKKVF